MELRRYRLLGAGRGRTLRPVVLTALVSALLVPVGSRAVATTSSEAQRVDVTINVPAMALDNICNGDVVASER